jgi:hypothetical protein
LVVPKKGKACECSRVNRGNNGKRCGHRAGWEPEDEEEAIVRKRTIRLSPNGL